MSGADLAGLIGALVVAAYLLFALLRGEAL